MRPVGRGRGFCNSIGGHPGARVRAEASSSAGDATVPERKCYHKLLWRIAFRDCFEELL